LSDEDLEVHVLRLGVATRVDRRVLAGIFPGAQLSNPTWDVMLDLFIQEMNGFRTSLDHLALTGDLPAATVYESVDALVELGLLERMVDRFDSRVMWLTLSVTGRQGMFDLLERASEFVRPVAGRLAEREGVEA
jgi:DNA-binding MarR family transcriptional regulator